MYQGMPARTFVVLQGCVRTILHQDFDHMLVLAVCRPVKWCPRIHLRPRSNCNAATPRWCGELYVNPSPSGSKLSQQCLSVPISSVNASKYVHRPGYVSHAHAHAQYAQRSQPCHGARVSTHNGAPSMLAMHACLPTPVPPMLAMHA